MSYAQRLHQGIDPLRSMANKGGGGGGGTSVTTQEIPVELKPLANQYTTSAIGLANTPYQPYYGQRYADLNGIQNQAISNIYQRAMGGDKTVQAGANYLQNTLNGQNKPAVGTNAYSGANPYLENAINRSMDDVQTRVNSQFSGSNYGTSANQEVLGRELGNVASNMRMQDYTTQQGLAENALNRNLQAWQLGNAAQANAASLGLGYGNQAYTDASQLMNAGQTLQDQQQQNLDFNYQQFLDQQNLPYKNLAALSGVFGSNLGGTSTTTSNQSSGGK